MQSQQELILDYLMNHSWEEVNIDDIVYHTGLTPKQVKKSIYNMQYKNSIYRDLIDTVEPGKVYKYMPNAHTTAKLEETTVLVDEPTIKALLLKELANTVHGLLMESADGELYLVKKLTW